MTRYLNVCAFFAAALLIVALAFVPRPVESDLGGGWKCSQNVMVTSCRHASVQ